MDYVEIVSDSVEDTKKIAEVIADNIRFGDTILLNGEMASGKTAFSRFVFNRLGYSGVSSPTFTIINQYNNDDIKSYHMDLYRLSSEEDLIEAGFEECDDGQLVIIEWADMFYTEGDNCEINIEIDIIDDNSRLFKIKARNELCVILGGLKDEDTGD